MNKRAIFEFINAKEFLPFFCGIPMSAMTKHKMRGKDGNGKPVDFTTEEWDKINDGVGRFHKKFYNKGSQELTLQDLIDDQAWKQTHIFKLAKGVGMYVDVEPTTGALCVIYRAGKGRGKDAKRWMPPTTQVELVNIKNVEQ